jgi:palmitoyltransferase
VESLHTPELAQGLIDPAEHRGGDGPGGRYVMGGGDELTDDEGGGGGWWEPE